jgi:hypothetical protein
MALSIDCMPETTSYLDRSSNPWLPVKIRPSPAIGFFVSPLSFVKWSWARIRHHVDLTRLNPEAKLVFGRAKRTDPLSIQRTGRRIEEVHVQPDLAAVFAHPEITPFAGVEEITASGIGGLAVRFVTDGDPDPAAIDIEPIDV